MHACGESESARERARERERERERGGRPEPRWEVSLKFVIRSDGGQHPNILKSQFLAHLLSHHTMARPFQNACLSGETQANWVLGFKV